MGDLALRFAEATGCRLAVSFGEAGEVRERIVAGEAFDLAMLPAATLAELARLGWIDPGSIVAIASTEVGMAVRTGAARPDIGSADVVPRLAARHALDRDHRSRQRRGQRRAFRRGAAPSRDRGQDRAEAPLDPRRAQCCAGGARRSRFGGAARARDTRRRRGRFRADATANLPAPSRSRPGFRPPQAMPRGTLIGFLSGQEAAAIIAAAGMQPAAGT